MAGGVALMKWGVRFWRAASHIGAAHSRRGPLPGYPSWPGLKWHVIEGTQAGSLRVPAGSRCPNQDPSRRVNLQRDCLQKCGYRGTPEIVQKPQVQSSRADTQALWLWPSPNGKHCVDEQDPASYRAAARRISRNKCPALLLGLLVGQTQSEAREQGAYCQGPYRASPLGTKQEERMEESLERTEDTQHPPTLGNRGITAHMAIGRSVDLQTASLGLKI